MDGPLSPLPKRTPNNEASREREGDGTPKGKAAAEWPTRSMIHEPKRTEDQAYSDQNHASAAYGRSGCLMTLAG